MSEHGILEFPVTGCYDYPLTILDSFSFRFAEDRTFEEKEYGIQFRKTVDSYSVSQKPIILNYYADPSQVFDFDEFYKSIEHALSMGFEFVTFKEIVHRIRELNNQAAQ